jgi:hypothetical protein
LGHIAFRGSACALNEEELALLDLHLQEHLYLSAKAFARWVEATFGVSYTESGMTALLQRPGYVHKKSKLVPGKADPAAKEAHLEDFKKLKEAKGEHDPIYFMDATHPQHNPNPVAACDWIKRGEDRQVRSNTGRRRLNINGAIGLERLGPVVRFNDTIDADFTIALLNQLEEVNLAAIWIYVVCDNARYYRSKAVKAYLKTSRIKLVSLPAYAPNLNLIQRFWKFF